MPTDYKGKIIHNMSQTKFNELLESNGGKLPAEFANSIVHTRAEDVNFSQLRTELVYDMNSDDPEKNWGYNTGLNGTYTKNIPTKFKTLIFYFRCFYSSFSHNGATCGVLELDMSNDEAITGVQVPYYSGGGLKNTQGFALNVAYRKSDNTLKIHFAWNDALATSLTDYRVYKIEGVLKTPALVYTGAELHDGNGISVKDGVVGIVPAQAPSLNTTKVGQNDTVVEYYVSSDATSWYRKWASGWKECGGCFMSADTSSGVYLAFPITFEQSVHAIQFTDTESVWNAHGCIPKALYWPGNDPANYDGKAGMRVLTPALNTGTTYAKHRISYYAQGY